MTRIAIIERDRCNPHKCGNLCVKVCPRNRAGEKCIYIGKDKKPYINEELCIGCGICVRKCLFNCINIVNLPEELKIEPIQRFGKNMFSLYSLPTPKFDKVVGIVGRNGIGKTTAINILTGNLIPNLNDLEKKPNKAQIIKKYSTSLLGNYFARLYSKKIKIAYKPQRIELLPKLYKGKIKNLMKRVDEKGIASKLLKELNLEQIKNRDIAKLAGGELQLLAIVATACKDANFYYFDEPASFCDVTHRIKIAKLIRSLAKNAAVMVVEHDLATLDYISDEIQIVYGKPGCYGVISQSKGVRRGINEYLDGYLPEDNVRFRSYQIKFSRVPRERMIQKATLLKFPSLEKNFKSFALKVNAGEVYKGEVLAVMGANGLGKTTFLKMLAGMIKPDKGKIEKMRIAYKVQYPSSVEGTVMRWLKSIAKAQFNSGWYKANILKKLDLNRILEREIASLSGGELQKVWIAATLSSDAKILAFDEPSAFIDVEDRLKVAEVIKDFVNKRDIAAIVVDHDVQFIDYVGDSMLIFEGIPGKEGRIYGPLAKREGMNRVLGMLDITYRKDKETNRPRVNKPDSVKDRVQKQSGEYYYID